MPHITPDAVRHFVKSIAGVKAAFQSTFGFILPALKIATARNLTLVRVESVDLGIILQAFSLTQAWDNKDQEFRKLDVVGFKRRYIYNGLTFAALDTSHKPLVVFLAKSPLDDIIIPGPVLHAPEVSCIRSELQRLAAIAFEYLSQLCNPVRQNCLTTPHPL
ncbi:hypothetical protein BDV38DRAFT_249223 [Aspergillus pseudotamarii]|uniref:Uncharacterized protein n=1 Tax=Aspergillus pseudotamarii TaxID=132259 RepID=A0A5N6SRU1_ASPPS|nr:uncharacterized protein BDV38DRAFT_249223 [Aspergillus pseudotamarii]KAE8136539.1 hypothetical protein BDV38DRAFT_249223 [Aspergillus pseudotamarii]